MKRIIDRLRILQYRLSGSAISTSIKKELKEIIEELENGN